MSFRLLCLVSNIYKKKNFKKESKKKQSHGKLQFTTLADFPTHPLDSREKYSTLTGKSKLTILVQMKLPSHSLG